MCFQDAGRSRRAAPAVRRSVPVRGWQAGDKELVCTFVPESKAAPATARIVSLRNGANAVVASKTFYQARQADAVWSPTSRDVAVLAGAQGGIAVYLLSEQGAVRLDLPSGHVDGVTWSPDGTKCVVTHGVDKAAWLVDRAGQRLFNFGGNRMSRSVAEFARAGDNLLLAGLYGGVNEVEVWQLGGAGTAPAPVVAKKAGNLAVCRFADVHGTTVLAAGTERFESQNGYKVIDASSGAVVAEYQSNKLIHIDVLLPLASTAPAAPAPGAAAAAAGPPASREELEKRLKAVTKKLKQLEPLKEKQRLGIALEANQVTKLASEAEWQAEVAQLTAALAAL